MQTRSPQEIKQELSLVRQALHQIEYICKVYKISKMAIYSLAVLLGVLIGRGIYQDLEVATKDTTYEMAKVCKGITRREIGEAHIFYGKKLVEDGKLEEGIARFELAIDKAPENFEGWLGKGKVLYQLGEYDKAVIALESADRRGGTSAETWLLRGRVQDKLGEHEKAVYCYREALNSGLSGEEVEKVRKIVLDYDEKKRREDEQRMREQQLAEKKRKEAERREWERINFYREDFSRYNVGDPLPDWGPNVTVLKTKKGSKYLGTQVEGYHWVRQQVRFPNNFSFQFQVAGAEYENTPIILVDSKGRQFKIDFESDSWSWFEWHFRLPNTKVVERDVPHRQFSTLNLVKSGNTYKLYLNGEFILSCVSSRFSRFVEFKLVVAYIPWNENRRYRAYTNFWAKALED